MTSSSVSMDYRLLTSILTSLFKIFHEFDEEETTH